MDEQPLDVKFDVLRLAARDAREAAEILAGKLDAHLPPCNHHPGWATNAALNACTSAWATHLNGHVEEGHDVGQRFHQTHASYSTTEDLGRRRARSATPPTEQV